MFAFPDLMCIIFERMYVFVFAKSYSSTISQKLLRPFWLGKLYFDAYWYILALISFRWLLLIFLQIFNFFIVWTYIIFFKDFWKLLNLFGYSYFFRIFPNADTLMYCAILLRYILLFIFLNYISLTIFNLMFIDDPLSPLSKPFLCLFVYPVKSNN